MPCSQYERGTIQSSTTKHALAVVDFLFLFFKYMFFMKLKYFSSILNFLDSVFNHEWYWNLSDMFSAFSPRSVRKHIYGC